MNPNLNIYAMADQIERHRVNSRPELLTTRRVRPVRVIVQPIGPAGRARLGGVVPSLLGKVQSALPLRRSRVLSR